MKKSAFAAAVIGLLLGTPALAADMVVKAPPPAPAPVATWTGWYVGLNAGGDWTTSRTSTTIGGSTVAPFFDPGALPLINALGVPTNLHASGFTGGVHGGYNYQIGRWLVGAEVDFESFRSNPSNSVVGPGFAPGAIYTLNSSVSTNWLFTARPRVGIISNDWLLYGTGGLAVTRISGMWNFFTINGLPNSSENASVAANKVGWVVGGGIEKMLPGKWTIGAEYLYVNFGNISANSLAVTTGFTATNVFSHTADLNANIVRVRLSKSF
jgi:outer membrane immunogenic protein